MPCQSCETRLIYAMSKLLLGNEAMTRTTYLGFAPFVVVVVFVLSCFFVIGFWRKVVFAVVEFSTLS